MSENPMSTTPAPAPLAAKLYRPSRRAGELIFVSGQLPTVDGRIPATGLVGDGHLSVEVARQAAATAAGNCLRAAEEALGTLDDVGFVVKLSGYVASAPGFTDQAAVIDAASEVLLAELGERGQHARLAIGVAALPFGAPVEVEVILSVR
jgi:enamine deaminase RidA (YjgF/YER057c/UK114 family)